MSKLFRKYLLLSMLAAGFVAGCNSGETTPAVSADNGSDVVAPVVVDVSAAKTDEKPVVSDKTEVKPAVEEKTSEAGGILSVDKKLYDFGSIEPGGLKYGSFILTNTGKKQLEIDRVTAPCRCTIPELSKKSLAPGESVELKFTFNVGKSYGKVNKKINLTTKSPGKPSNMTLSFTANIRKVIDVQPEKLDFGLNASFNNDQELVITSTDGSEFRITGYICNGDAVVVKYDSAVKAKKHKLAVSVNLDNLRAAPAGLLTVKTDHPKIDRVTVRYGTKMPFDAFPRTKRFVPETESGRQAKIKVVSNFNEQFELGDISSKSGYLKVLDSRKSIDGYEVTIELDMEKVKELDKDKKYVSDYLIIPVVGHPEDTLEVHCYGLVR